MPLVEKKIKGQPGAAASLFSRKVCGEKVFLTDAGML
jgi:hypothetical protein